ncbi:MAG: DUF3849 domain-containing protein [Christensenellaceae bacterium]|nr:DUF3849 domain-containing protein [Christensenellaceae bacterium]
MKDIPVYKFPASYAWEHDELAAYRASNKANMACKEAIEAAIRDHYHNNCLGSGAVKQAIEQFGYDRVFYVLANTVRQKDWDDRFCLDNKAWAKTIPVFEDLDAWGADHNRYFVVNSHSCLTDLFLSLAREAHAREQQKASVRDKLKKHPKVTLPKISAKSKEQER